MASFAFRKSVPDEMAGGVDKNKPLNWGLGEVLDNAENMNNPQVWEPPDSESIRKGNIDAENNIIRDGAVFKRARGEDI